MMMQAIKRLWRMRGVAYPTPLWDCARCDGEYTHSSDKLFRMKTGSYKGLYVCPDDITINEVGQDHKSLAEINEYPLRQEPYFGCADECSGKSCSEVVVYDAGMLEVCSNRKVYCELCLDSGDLIEDKWCFIRDYLDTDDDDFVDPLYSHGSLEKHLDTVFSDLHEIVKSLDGARNNCVGLIHRGRNARKWVIDAATHTKKAWREREWRTAWRWWRNLCRAEREMYEICRLLSVIKPRKLTM